jgi:DNA-binding HxlR family transcriptional regulator
VSNRRHHDYNCNFGCSVEAALEIIGGKWKGVILFHLLEGTKRFNELRRLVPNVTQRMLTLQLRELEHDGVVQRKIYEQIPPRVEYSLTDFGRTLEPILQLIRAWGVEHIEQITARRSTPLALANQQPQAEA